LIGFQKVEGHREGLRSALPGKPDNARSKALTVQMQWRGDGSPGLNSGPAS
jgi:hypothetical protein